MQNLRKFAASIFIFGFYIFDAQAKDVCAKYGAEIASDQEYRVVFGDSSIDGLVFTLDTAQDLESRLKALEIEYKASFTFNHFIDNKNAPYDSKKPKEVALTKNFLEYLINLPNTHTAIFAPDVYGDKMKKYFDERYRDIKIITTHIDASAISATQDHTLSDKIYENILYNLPIFLYQKRSKALPLSCAKNIAINSELSSDNIAQIKEIISRTRPQYLEKISFKKITIN